MGFKHVLKAVGPVVAMAIAGSFASCGEGEIKFNGKEGVPLSELDLSGEPPSELILLGPDNLEIRDGEKLTIEVEGDDEARERMRFVLADGTLGILREKGQWHDTGPVTVIVTMPAPAKLTLAGSGRMTVASVSDRPEINMMGSGTLDVQSVAAASLQVNVAGSGTVNAAGSADSLELNIMGSGTARMGSLKAAEANINVAGSGNATFASDGEVDANIMGSGNVTVRGRARCKVKTMGSGSLVCEDDGEDMGKAA